MVTPFKSYYNNYFYQQSSIEPMLLRDCILLRRIIFGISYYWITLMCKVAEKDGLARRFWG